MTQTFRIDPKYPDPKEIAAAAQLILDGEVVAYPTETIYGLGADVFSRKAIKRIYDLK